MNLVFPALAVFVFLLPGLIYRAAYNRGWWNYPLGRLGTVSEQIPWSVAHAIWLNAVWALVVEEFHRWNGNLVWSLDYKSIIYWLSNNFGKNDAAFASAVHALSESPARVLAYFAGLFLYAYAMGLTLHTLVRWLKLDRKFRIFRFDNEWHYLLRGEILDFGDEEYRARSGSAREKLTSRDRAATMIAVVIEMKDANYLFRGVLIDFFYDEAGHLDRILIEDARRRNLGDDKGHAITSGDRYYGIRGHYLVIRMSEIKTINVDYILKKDVNEMELRARRMEAERLARLDIEPDGGLVG